MKTFVSLESAIFVDGCKLTEILLFRGNTFRGNTFRSKTFRANTFRGNPFRGNTFRGNTFSGTGAATGKSETLTFVEKRFLHEKGTTMSYGALRFLGKKQIGVNRMAFTEIV